MFCNYQLIHLPILAITMYLILQQLQFVLNGVTAAKHYNDPYGDIMLEEEPNSFQHRYESRDNQRFSNSYQAPSYGPKFQSEYQPQHQQQQQPVNGRRRGEREKSQYQNVENTRYATNNRNIAQGFQSRWPTSASTLGMPEIGNMTQESQQHKCKIWVPNDALDKYPDAEVVQANKITQAKYIEICCTGYAAMRWLGKTLCRPICDNCLNGRCVEPGVCECFDEFVQNDNGDCVFTCPMGCLNGRCYLDGSCQCDPGFKLDETRKFCRPICSKGCGSSLLHNCTEPEVCGCIKGYTLGDGDCQPTCEPDCGAGGICRERNMCDCSPGYTLKDGVCQSDCYQKCDNGICYNRNRCICNPGFTYHERSTQCIPK